MYDTHCPCPPWLLDRLKDAAEHVRSVDPATGAAGGGYACDLLRDHLDLTDLQTRAAVLVALAEEGEARGKDWRRPWALGVLWSALTDEQAARATVACILAVEAGREPPVGVLGEWQRWGHAGQAPGLTRYFRVSLVGPTLYCEYLDGQAARGWPQPRVVGAEAREAAEAGAHASGALLVGVDL